MPSLEPWDLAFFSERLREAKYAYSEEELKRHFELEDVMRGLFSLTKTIFGVEGGATIVGIVFKVWTTGRFRVVSTVAYVVMGWAAILAIAPLMRALNGLGVMWLATGGGLYTLGCVFYLWKSLPYAHMVWHLFVLAGTICHFFCIFWHVMK